MNNLSPELIARTEFLINNAQRNYYHFIAKNEGALIAFWYRAWLGLYDKLVAIKLAQARIVKRNF